MHPVASRSRLASNRKSAVEIACTVGISVHTPRWTTQQARALARHCSENGACIGAGGAERRL